MKFRFKILPVLLSFYLGVHGGQLALMEHDHPNPLKVYPIHIRMLPESDQIALSEGIEIQSKLHLAQMLEDYLS